MHRGLLLCAVWSFAFAAQPASAETPALSIHGPHESDVRAGLERTLLALDIHLDSGAVDVDLRELGAGAFRYQVGVKRAGGTFQRIGVARAEDLIANVSSVVLLGVLARVPDARPRIALVIDGERQAASTIATWKATLQQRGYLVLADTEVNLARSTLKNAGEPDAALAQLLGVRVVGIAIRSRGNEVAVQASVFDDEERRGSIAEVAAAEVEAQVALMLDFMPIQPRKMR